MPEKKLTRRELEKRVEELQLQLEEFRETLRAIREGEVDAIVVSGSRGEQIFSLSGAESVYRLIVESMKEAALTVTLHGDILYCNAQLGQLLKMPLELVVGRSLEDFVSEDNRESVSSLIFEATRGPVKRRLIFRSGDEVAVPVHISASLLDESSICMVASDLTELENSTEIIQKLRNQREFLERLIDSAGSCIAVVKGRELRYTIANSALQALAGDMPVIGRTYREVFPQAAEAGAEALIQRVLETGEPLSLEDYKAPISGRPDATWHGQIVKLPFSEGGEPLALIAVWDVTERKRAEEALRQSEERFKLSMEATNDGLWDWDVRTDRVYYSPSYYRILGYKPGSFPGTLDAWKELVHPDDLDRTFRTNMDCLEGRTESFAVEYRMKARTGEWRWILGRGKCIARDSKGYAVRLIGTHMDITERKWAEEALRESEQRYRAIVETAEEGIATHMPDGTITYVNQRLADMMGYSREEIIGRSSLDFVDDDERQRVIRVREGLKEEGNSSRERRLRRKDGSTLWTLANISPRRDAAGNFLGYLAMHTDITIRRQAEVELRRLNGELEARVAQRTDELAQAGAKIQAERQQLLDVLETLPVIVTLTRPDHRLEFVNRAYREAFGANLGRLCYESRFGRDEPCPDCQAFVPFQTGQPHHWEWTLPNGRTFDLHSFPFADADGSPMMLEMNIDITDRRQAERQLQQAHQELENRAAQLRQLAAELTLTEQRERKHLALVLHDGLQQILVAAKFQVALIERSKDVQKATAEVSNLIDDCIETSRSLTAELSPPILHQGGLIPALEWLGQWMFNKHRLSVELTAQGQLGRVPEEITILLFQSVRELLFNIVKHAGTKKARIGIGQSDNRIRIEVCDDGLGFDPEQVQNRACKEGSGIGLFSIRERLGYLGGTIEIDSAPGRGAMFILTSPMLAAASVLQDTSAGPRTSAAYATRPGANQADATKIRIVLVDDHLVMRQGLASLLSTEPDILVVGEASDGRSAIDLVRDLKPSVVLMDISMPGMDGIQATKLIHEQMPEVKVIGLSMFQQGEQAAAIREAGAVGYLTKTGPSDAVVEAIRSAMKRQKRAVGRSGYTDSEEL